MTPETKARLLASMNAGRLVAVCGAGLSMAPPSNLPSARRVAEMCFDEYRLTADPNCDIALRTDLEALAEHFVGLNTLESVFIERIVPWTAFTKPSNPGHAAIADFLITRAFTAGLSTNYDTLIERYAWDNGFDFRGSLDGDEANIQAAKQGPLLKFHGCALQDRLFTVWAPSQLQEPKISMRIEKSKTWMAANLRQRDLLVVGFWSDWTYLNAVIGSALKDVSPLSVTVVDLSDSQQLEQKAPDLWALAHGDKVTFEHIRESGADVLDELRRAFSQNYLRQMLEAGRQGFEAEIGGQSNPVWLDVADAGSEILYGWRRDAEGVPAGEPARQLHPVNCEVLGYFHLLLRRAGALEHPEGYELNGRTVRVLNGAGALLSKVQGRFVEAPPLPAADVIVAVGAVDLGVPANVVRHGQVGSVIRPAPAGAWFDTIGARAELNV